MPDRGISRSDQDHSIINSRPVQNHLPPTSATKSSHEYRVRSPSPKPSDAHRHRLGSHGPGPTRPDNSACIWPATIHDTDSEPGNPAACSGPTQTGWIAIPATASPIAWLGSKTRFSPSRFRSNFNPAVNS